MGLKIYQDLIQGSAEWISARLGLLTASEMKHIITPKKLEYSSNDKERAHVWELTAQRITGHADPHYVSDDMMRGFGDEVEAKIVYDKHYAPLTSVGFITNDKWGFTLGYSPDALVGEDGVIEVKSRRQKYQVETILKDEVPDDYMIQIQTGLLVSERSWCDFISYSGGLPMYVKRVPVDLVMQEMIVKAATKFYEKMEDMIGVYESRLKERTFIPTERRIEQEIII